MLKMALLGLIVVGVLSMSAVAEEKAGKSIYDFTMNDIDGKPVQLSQYKGKVLMVVNTASKCGLTPQYKQLEALYDQYKGQGFEILGFPANEFNNQEPGSNADIKQFCTDKYDVSFPMFSKIVVKGQEIHPLYAHLTGPQSPQPGEIQWNFAKFLISRDGKIVGRFAPKTKPDAQEVTAAIEKEIAKK